jgi:Fe2+ transport system protein FeoA
MPSTTPHTAPMTSLDQVAPGSCAVVRHVGGETMVRQRLLEMGFVSGAVLRVVRWAPLGDPMQVELHGTHISLRRSEARTILVQTD